jgi:hypothetical protein
MKGLTGAILIVVMVFAGPAFAQFYKYLNKQGEMRFTVNEEKPAGPEPPAAAAATVGEGEDLIEGTRTRLDALKKTVEAEYQVLVKEKGRLAKEKETQKTREGINAYNKEVEAFNQQAESFEKKNSDLRKLAEDYNTLVNEANSKAAAAPKK